MLNHALITIMFPEVNNAEASPEPLGTWIDANFTCNV